MLVCRDDNKKIIYVTPGRDLVADESEAMSRELGECMCQDVEALVLDLARVRAIDALGFDTIIDVCSRVCKSGGKLIIENASREMKERFRLLRISGRITISSTGWPS
jgi:anti-sigma B factor antagonist